MYNSIDYIMGCMIALVMLFCTVTVMEFACGETKEIEGEVYNEMYTPSTQETGVGMAITGKGVAPVVNTSGHPEEYAIIVKADNHFYKVPCSIDQFYQNKEHGTPVRITVRYGYFSKRQRHASLNTFSTSIAKRVNSIY